MIIVCPNCSTRYEVAAQAIGDHGRSVQCANCQRSWHAQALVEDDFGALLGDALNEPPKAKKPKAKKTTPADEDEMDVAFSAEEDNAALDEGDDSNRIGDFELPDDDDPFGNDDDGSMSARTAVGSAIDAAQDVMNAINEDNEVELSSYAARRRQQIERMKRSRRIAKRRREIARALPMAKLRRNISFGALGVSLLFIAVLFGFSTRIVQFYPDMAGFYRLFGQSINVVGLEFADVKTDRVWSDGHEVLTVRAKIENVTERMIYLPPIRVALLDEHSSVIYEWNTTPGLAVLEAGGLFDFKAELSSPPNDVRRVKLKFLDWQNDTSKPSMPNQVSAGE
ncbi:zinc-ribbon domain-containing protein [uncultured Maritalea sp.]|jgi:predicted Zn finger-like uncharacterized protein|uniref:zinc-ribbon domain-containing protein n=1 Tax=uncultured Maritalea sp. TaxID=757249 RepID=UPI0026388807|nr:zinc-ribbon domain-containing protein [uncultured Maritalea sp.]